MDEAAVCVAGGSVHEFRALAAGLFAGVHPADDTCRTVGIDLDSDFQEALALAAIQCQHAVTGYLVQRLCEVVILGLGAGDAAERTVVAAQFGAAGSIIGDSLSDDILRPGQRGGCVGDLVVKVRSGGFLGVKRSVLFQNRIGQRLQAPGLGDAGAGLALGFIGAVDVLDLGQGLGLGQRGGQFGRHGPLLGDGGGDFLLALIEAAQIFQTVAQIAQYLIVHRAGGLLAVAGDKGDGVPLVDQFNSPLDIFDIQVQFLG